MAEQEIRGEQVVVRFDGERCIHARNCVLGRPDVFVPNAEGSWIKPDNASAEAVAAIGANCPSGAIRVERLDGGEQEAPPKVNTVRVRENGPLAINAAMDVAGNSRLRATLCRCGASSQKPYCDGSHNTVGFVASGEVAIVDSTPLSARDGQLVVKPLPNGPLMVTGNLEVVTGTGKTANRVEKTFLCRCGGSANKPYCDGTHRAIGFTTG